MLTILYLILIIISLLLIKQFIFNKKSENFYYHNLDQNEQSDPSRPNFLEHRHDTSSASDFDSINGGEDGGEDGEDSGNNEQTDPSVSVTSQPTSDTSQTDEFSEDPVGTTESIAPSEPIITTSSDRSITPQEYWRLLVENLRESRERESNSTVPIFTAQTDDECCGLTIYNDDLQNINKCIEQHIQPGRDGITQNPVYSGSNKWKELEDDQSCKNPPHILVKTTNCSGGSSVIERYYPHITTLYNLISPETNECPYRVSPNHSSNIIENNDEESQQSNNVRLSDSQQLRIFLANRTCRNSNFIRNDLVEQIFDTPHSIPIRKCSEQEPR